MPIKIIPDKCNGCQICIPACPYGAIGMEGDKAVLFESCVHCGICIDSCPLGAIIELSESGEILQKTNSYSNILVIGEVNDNSITNHTKELLGKARELADIIGVKVSAIVYGIDENMAKEAFVYGADDICLLEGISADSHKTPSLINAFSDIIERKRPEIILFSETPAGSAFAARIAQRFTTGILSGCVSLEIDSADRVLSCTKPLYSGKIMGIVSCSRNKPQIAILKEGAFRMTRYQERTGNIEKIGL